MSVLCNGLLWKAVLFFGTCSNKTSGVMAKMLNKAVLWTRAEVLKSNSYLSSNRKYPFFREMWKVHLFSVPSCESTVLFSTKRYLDSRYQPPVLTKVVRSLRKGNGWKKIIKIKRFQLFQPEIPMYAWLSSRSVNWKYIMFLRNSANRWLDKLLRKNTTHFDLVYHLSNPPPHHPLGFVHVASTALLLASRKSRFPPLARVRSMLLPEKSFFHKNTNIFIPNNTKRTKDKNPRS